MTLKNNPKQNQQEQGMHLPCSCFVNRFMKFKLHSPLSQKHFISELSQSPLHKKPCGSRTQDAEAKQDPYV